MSNSGDEKFEKLFVFVARRKIFHFGIVHEEHSLMVHVIKILSNPRFRRLPLKVGR